MASEFRIEGLDAVLAKMRGLAPNLKKKGLTAAMRKAMAIVRKDAVAKARQFDDPATKQSIAKEIVVRANAKLAKRLGPLTYLVQVGVKGGAKSYVNSSANRRQGRVGQSYEGGGNVYHWRFLEFGTEKMAARPFMRPALANNVQRVTDTFVTEAGKAIDNILAKGG